jgi:hypothetical protein
MLQFVYKKSVGMFKELAIHFSFQDRCKKTFPFSSTLMGFEHGASFLLDRCSAILAALHSPMNRTRKQDRHKLE